MERILHKVNKELRDKPCPICNESEIKMNDLLGLSKKELVKIIEYKNDVLIQYVNWVDELKKK